MPDPNIRKLQSQLPANLRPAAMPSSSSKNDASSSSRHDKDRDRDDDSRPYDTKSTTSSKSGDREKDKDKDKDSKKDKSKSSTSTSSNTKSAIPSSSAVQRSSNISSSTTASAAERADRDGGASSARGGATKRLLKEMAAWEKENEAEAAAAAAASSSSSSRKDKGSSAAPFLREDGIERLGPVSEGELLRWEAVINGRGIGGGYDGGRWLLEISVPPTYPLHPPTVRFATPVVHANVSLDTGEICLDLLRNTRGAAPGSGADDDSAWTPAYTLAATVRAVRRLLGLPGLDSPLNVDVAALLRGGDHIAARALVELWIRDRELGGRWEGR